MSKTLANHHKVALAMIVKDNTEKDDLRRCLNSIAPFVDGIFLTGTKEPQGEIKKIAKEYGANYSFFKWCKDFSKARNFNFKQIPAEYEWIIWLDVDDVLTGGEKIQEAISLAEQNNIKAIFTRYLYQVDLDEQGRVKNVVIEHLRERILKNGDWIEWVGKIHETVIGKVPVGQTDYQGLEVIHLSNWDDMINSMYRNIDILEEEVCENPSDPRPIYYLAKSYFDTHEADLLYKKAGEDVDSITVELLKDYLRKSGWAEERAQALEYLSMIYRERGDIKKAIDALTQSVTESPKFVSAYIQLALCYVTIKDWEKASHWVKIASQVELPKTTLVVNPRDYKTMILEVLYHINLNTGKLELTEKVMGDLFKLIPNEINRQRYKDIVELKYKNDLAHHVVKLAYHLKITNQLPQLQALVNSIPNEISQEPALVDLKNQYTPIKNWENDEIAIYCGPGWEKWSPKNLAKGIGGSEEAVINMSRELANQGWKVTVFGDPQEDEGIYEGVKYSPYFMVNWNDNFNILISWRQIGLFDLPIKAKKTYLWNHDLQNALEYTKERVDKIDKVMFLSKFHRSNVPDLDEGKVMYTSNGVNI